MASAREDPADWTVDSPDIVNQGVSVLRSVYAHYSDESVAQTPSSGLSNKDVAKP